MIKLSIIIPHYNSVKLLKKLLDFIPSKEEIQVIVIDDRSNKDLEELQILMNCKEYSHVHFLKNEAGKKGAGACRNIGLNKASGDWILFADSDDFFVEGFFECLYEFFTSDYEVVFFKPTSIEIDTGEKSDRHQLYEKLISGYIDRNDMESETRIRYQYLVPWSKLIRRSFLLDNKIYFDEVIASNDVMFSTKVGYYMKRFHVSGDVIYCVTRSHGTLTMNISEAVYDSRLKVLIEYCSFLRSKLSKQELKVLNLKGTSILMDAIKYKLGIKKFFNVYFELKKNKIKVFDSSFINPVFIKKYYSYYKKYLNQKKYMSK